jgi:hypothetical protein
MNCTLSLQQIALNNSLGFLFVFRNNAIFVPAKCSLTTFFCLNPMGAESSANAAVHTVAIEALKWQYVYAGKSESDRSLLLLLHSAGSGEATGTAKLLDCLPGTEPRTDDGRRTRRHFVSRAACTGTMQPCIGLALECLVTRRIYAG